MLNVIFSYCLVIMLSVIFTECYYAECHLRRVTVKPIMLNVIMLNAMALSVRFSTQAIFCLKDIILPKILYWPEKIQGRTL